MERVLADILREEGRLGNKGDGGWKIAAYNSVAAILSAQFDVHITVDNIQNCLKSWKKFCAIVSDILSQSGFNWDATKKMMSVDEDPVWQEYVKSHDCVKSFHCKVIPNYDIVDLCGKDRTIGEGAETCLEAVEIMTPPYNESDHIDLVGDTQSLEDIEIVNKISPISATGQKTQRKRKPANAKKLDPTEVYDEVNAIPDLS
ncbi:uncharacterized protein [Malus domestica]|uniref:uncharacterized protein n=1 Tax=Malus domestica TaxID=3750 RepID=UPI0039748A76